MLDPKQPVSQSKETTPMGNMSEEGGDTPVSALTQNPAPTQQPKDQNGQVPAGQSPTANGQYDTGIHQALEQHLNSLPPVQQAFLNHYLTPEIVTVLGIIGGAEVYDYLKKYTDPSKMAVIVPRNSVPQGGQALQDDQEAENSTTDNNSDTENAEQAPAPQEASSQESETPTVK